MPNHLSYLAQKCYSFLTFGRPYTMNSFNLEKFKTICTRIGLNIPTSNRWAWDNNYNHALVVFDKDDLELILLPITLEFEQTWDFTTIGDSSRLVSRFINAGFGLMPGQNLFIAADNNAAGLLLYATCWPWGNGDKFSLRVGIFSEDPDSPNPEMTKDLLTDWFNIPES